MNMESLLKWIGHVGAFASGYKTANLLAKDTKPVFIGNTRIHHYNMGIGALITKNTYFQAFLLGMAFDDLPDLIKDVYELITRNNI